jgi:antitoxin ParD1/3/4
MNISITPELEKLVNTKVESGMYQSASEVVREALRLLAERDELRRTRRQKLEQDIQAGLDQIARGEILTAQESATRMDAFKKAFLHDRDV